VNVDPELRKRVEQIKSSPVQLYREAGDYSNRELVEGILVSPDDIDGWDRRRLERYLIDVVIKHASIHWITISADGSDDVWPSALR
jgi:hypothetical protein